MGVARSDGGYNFNIVVMNCVCLDESRKTIRVVLQ